MYTCIYWEYTHVYLCRLVYTQCIPLYTDVYSCILVYTDVYPCILVQTHVYWCLSMYTGVNSCIYTVYTVVYPCIPVYTYVYGLLVTMYTGIYLRMYTGVYILCVYFTNFYTGIHERYQGNMVLNHATYGPFCIK